MRFNPSIPALMGALLCAGTALAQDARPAAVDPARPDAAAADHYADPIRGIVPFRPEYELWFGDERREARYGRTALELLGVLAVGTTYYWIVSDPNKVDWDYVDLEDRALHTEVKFDNNMFRTNFLLHPLAGTMSYWLARSNGLDVYVAFTYSALSSATFEFLLEWLEKPSINDLVVTPFGGIAAGEFFFHLGDYLNSALGHETPSQRILAYTLGLPQAIHNPLDGLERAPPSTMDALGYTSAYWHRFSVGYGIARVSDDRGVSGTVHDLLFDAELVAMPGFGRPGHIALGFHQGNFTEAHLRTSVEEGLLRDVDLFIGSSLAGVYRQDYEDAGDSVRGSASMIAASVDMRYVDRWLLGRRDQFAMFHWLGPSAKTWATLGSGVAVEADARLHLDLAAIRSPAYQELVAEYGQVGTKSVLQLQDYYQGLGASGRTSVRIAIGGVELGGRAAYGAYRSIDGLDRFDTTRDVMNTDQIIELGAHVAYAPPSSPLFFRVGWDRLEHRSQMGPISVPLADRRLSTSATFRF